ncbi:MAG: Gfo/Idh/MocA family oxidoreductase [Pyrodictiaceae archaeon]
MVIRAAIVGAGYMGTAHARIINRIASENPSLVELDYVIDKDISRARRVAAIYGGKPLASISDLPRGSVDLAFVAVPTRLHLEVFHQLASRDISAFFIEKPLAASIEEAENILRVAEENSLWVSAGHVERFNPAVIALHKLVAEGRLGKLFTLVSRRVGPFAPRAGDTDVVYDLGVHEIDNVLALLARIPDYIKAYTIGSIVSDLNDYALLVMRFEKTFASIEVNRITPFKQRILYITGSKAVAFLDYRSQDLYVYTPWEESKILFKREEPLYLEDLSVIESLAKKEAPVVDVYQGFTPILLGALGLEHGGEKQYLEKILANYQDYLDKALKGYRRYRVYVEKVSEKLLYYY